MDEYLAQRLDGFEELTERDREFVESKPIWMGHLSSPEEEGYRRDVLALCESAAIANGATRKMAEDEEGDATASASLNTLGLALSAKAYLDERAKSFQAFESQVQLARVMGTGHFLRTMSATDALSSGRINPLLVERLNEDAPMFLPLTNGDMDKARLHALAGYMRSPLEGLLDSIDEFDVEEVPGKIIRIHAFERISFLSFFSGAVKSLARSYGLVPEDVAALILEGRPARLSRGSWSVKRHTSAGALDQVTLKVPAHVSPDFAIALFTAVRDARGRPRALGKRNTALLEMRARLTFETGQDDLNALYERWNRDPEVPEEWRFKARFRFNAALQQADARLLRRDPVSLKKMAEAFDLLGADGR